MQARVPSIHVRKVMQGRVKSSVVGTVNATCSIGEFSVGSTGKNAEVDASELPTSLE